MMIGGDDDDIHVLASVSWYRVVCLFVCFQRQVDLALPEIVKAAVTAN